jgi:drug/metabolite transporter (DMT)-like permease
LEASAPYTAALIALLVSAMYGVAAQLQRLGLDHIDARSGAIVNIGMSALIGLLAAPFFLEPASLLTRAAGLFALAGLIVPALSISVAMVSVRIIGPSLTTGLAGTSPIFAMLLSVLWIGEVITWQIALGTFIVIVGVMLAAGRPSSGAGSWPLWALALPTIAALCRGIAHPLTKLGLMELPSPVTAMLVSAMVSIVVAYSIFRVEGRRLPPFNRGYLWFILTGTINGVGIILLNVALDIGTVTIVSPIIAASPVFALLAGYFYFKREVITWQTVAAIALIFGGCVLIVLR